MSEPVNGAEGGPQAVSALVFRIADSNVLIGVRSTERGPEPLFTDVGGEPCAVAYTDPEEIRRDLPEDYRLFQITVPELLMRLPVQCGLVIDPRAASPLYVAAAERDAVIAAGQPFPAGAPVRIKQGGDRQPALVAAALPRVAAVGGVRRVYLTRYQVADAREKVLVAYEADAEPAGTDAAAADAFMAAAAEVELADAMQVVALDDIPEELRRIVLEDVPPVYVRADLRDGLRDGDA
ncbi:enhanced serine sensitivity protein SseB C-terminal domain-containing protein [Actinacidiphila alni]|uniref:enhanced serine sensitivity protein SseB C-terminal domain-containing protein n=1 Tax=Actinacidiphila alni TaxID=380248 RepID=UPI0034527C7B